MHKHEIVVVQNDTGIYTAYMKNFPEMVVQSESIDEVKEKLKKLFVKYVEYLKQTIVDKDDPFYIVTSDYIGMNDFFKKTKDDI